MDILSTWSQLERLEKGNLTIYMGRAYGKGVSVSYLNGDYKTFSFKFNGFDYMDKEITLGLGVSISSIYAAQERNYMLSREKMVYLLDTFTSDKV